MIPASKREKILRELGTEALAKARAAQAKKAKAQSAQVRKNRRPPAGKEELPGSKPS